MKNKFLLFATLILVALMGCEKDDICAEGTPTTPNMVAEFFNAENTSVNKPVNNIKYFVEGRTDTITITGSESVIKVPLRIDAASTKWGFIYTSTPTGSTDPVENIDYIEFNYTTQQSYVSRACGYKSVFFLEDVTLIEDTDMWMSEVHVEKFNIEDENETHISIYY